MRVHHPYLIKNIPNRLLVTKGLENGLTFGMMGMAISRGIWFLNFSVMAIKVCNWNYVMKLMLAVDDVFSSKIDFMLDDFFFY